MKTITIRLADVEAVMLLELQRKRNILVDKLLADFIRLKYEAKILKVKSSGWLLLPEYCCNVAARFWGKF